MRLLLSAVEPSADRLGAALLGELGQVDAEGIGGEGMLAAGLRPLATPHAAMGVGELFGKLRHIRANRQALLSASPPECAVGIDAPDFHLPILRALRRRGVPTVGWVSPQLWAWRPGRARAVADSVDVLLCLFPFEPALYAGTGLDARFVGHPVIDRVGPSRREPGTVAIFPGSRPAEVRRHLDVFLAATTGWPRRLLVRAPGVELPPVDGVELVDSATALATAERALTKSGTTTLELTLAGIPTVVAHRVGWLTYTLGRLLVRGVDALALPNVLLRRKAVPEFIQDFDAPALRRALETAPAPPREEVRALLGEPGVAARVAAVVRERAATGSARS